MNKPRRAWAASVLCLPLLMGCGTIIRGTTQDVAVGTSPSRARVWVDGHYTGLTPVIMNLARKDDHTIRIELEGYEPHTVTLTKKVAGSVIGSFILGIGIGLAVDAISGGLYFFEESPVHINLKKPRQSL